MGATRGPVDGVSLVVVNWNSGAHLGRLLDSLCTHPPGRASDVVVVDNGSRDGSEAAARRPGVSLIRNVDNRGLAAANNQGMAAATGAYFLLCNPDVELTTGAIDEMVAVMERHDRAAFVVPRLRRVDGGTQVSAGDLPSLAEALLGRAFLRRAGSRRPSAPGPEAKRGWWWHGWAHDREQEIGRGAEACYLVRRGAVAEFGLQDERFPLDWEGVEWTARAHDAGWQVWFAPGAEVVHTGGVSIDQARLRWVWQSHLGMYRYFAPRVSSPARYPLALAVVLRALLKAAAVGARLPVYRWAR